MPNYFQRGRTQLIYLDAHGKRTNTPLHVYLVNALLPEEELCNFGIKTVGIIPRKTLQHLPLIADAHDDFWNGKLRLFFKAYHKLHLSGSNPGSFAYAQAFNDFIGSKYDGIYITQPRKKSSKPLSVVFFCHGAMGSWELYQGILRELENCLVVSLGTPGLNGLFTHDDVERIFSKYLPYLKEAGYNIDESRLHIMGLSNGGTAVNIALNSYSHHFKTITFVSTWCKAIRHSTAKVVLVGSGQDRSAEDLPAVKKSLEQAGIRSSLLFFPEEDHFIIATKADEVVEFLNKELGLICM